MLWHLDRLAEWRTTGDTFPFHMEINLTNYCNEACRWCLSAYSHVANPSMSSEEKARQVEAFDGLSQVSGHPERRRGLEIGYLRSFLDQAKAKGLLAVGWSGGGEPTTHSHILDAVTHAARLGLEQGLFTNGLFKPSYVPVLGDNLRWVRVSLDTLDAERYSYQKLSEGFPQVVENIRGLVERAVKVGVSMNVAKWNCDEILTLSRWCRDIGVDYFQIRPTLGLPFETKNNDPYRDQPDRDWLSRIEPLLCEAETFGTADYQVLVSWDKFRDLADVEGNYGRTYQKCLCHYFSCVLNANGDLTVCMYHLDDSMFTFGNIYEQSVEEIWHGPKRQQVLDMCANQLDLSTCQVCCKGHEVNKFLHLVAHPDSAADVHSL